MQMLLQRLTDVAIGMLVDNRDKLMAIDQRPYNTAQIGSVPLMLFMSGQVQNCCRLVDSAQLHNPKISQEPDATGCQL